MLKSVLWLARIAAFWAGVYWSFENVAGYWVVGPIFAAVVLFWYAGSVKDVFNIRAGAYAVSSTLIYALVYYLFENKKLSRDDLYIPVAVGTVLLPLAHKLFLKAGWRRTLVAVPGIYLVWYWSAPLTHDVGPSRPLLQHFVNIVLPWQAAYLVFMLGRVPRKHPK